MRGIKYPVFLILIAQTALAAETALPGFCVRDDLLVQQASDSDLRDAADEIRDLQNVQPVNLDLISQIETRAKTIASKDDPFCKFADQIQFDQTLNQLNSGDSTQALAAVQKLRHFVACGYISTKLKKSVPEVIATRLTDLNSSSCNPALTDCCLLYYSTQTACMALALGAAELPKSLHPLRLNRSNNRGCTLLSDAKPKPVIGDGSPPLDKFNGAKSATGP